MLGGGISAGNALSAFQPRFQWSCYEHGVKATELRTSVASKGRHESAVGSTLRLEVRRVEGEGMR